MLTDLKYNMQHLLPKVMFATNGQAALRFLDGVIKDVETVQHVPWIYAMRFLRASLALETSQTQETLIAVSLLKVVATLATSRGDHAVAAKASVVEALVHLQHATNLDGIEQAQRALAAARSS
jgi:Cohesin loading factor